MEECSNGGKGQRLEYRVVSASDDDDDGEELILKTRNLNYFIKKYCYHNV